MLYRIEVKEKPGVFDAVGKGIEKDILDLKINSVQEVQFVQVYLLETSLSENQIIKIAEEILTDPITQEYKILTAAHPEPDSGDVHIVEVAFKPGVMDPWEASIKKAISDMGIAEEVFVKTAKRYIIKGRLTNEQVNSIAEKLLYNKVIQDIVRGTIFEISKDIPEYKFKLVRVDISNSNDEQLKQLSKTGQLFLNLAEMKAIQEYFRNLERNPTDIELESIAQTWSEHCSHKTLKGSVEYEEDGAKAVRFKSLLKETVMAATKDINKKWCVSVFMDNAGIIEFDNKYNVCFKVETHNHPSALEPYGGSGTGVGGVIRDTLGAGLGAKPILNTDVFCFASPDFPYDKLPAGILHPKRIMKGVVSGVRDYGNRMGIPTLNGAIIFDDRFLGNPLVFCGNVGIMPKDKSFKNVLPGDLILVIGGRTGRDGIHGATFSSGELTPESESVSGGAVQIGNPIEEKKVTDTLLEAQEENLFRAVTDCGAGGFSSAVAEMGNDTGAEVDLEKAPLKYKGLTYTEIWISEAQERMVFAVPPQNLERILEIFRKEFVEATVIGKFTETKRLILKYEGNLVCDIDMQFLHNGVPNISRKAVWNKPKFDEPVFEAPKDLTSHLTNILSSYNTASKEWVIRQYDHEVQGGSVIKPLVGVKNDGPSDAAVVKPRLDSKKAIAVACGINSRYGFIDPYWMAASNIDECLRQIVCVGGSVDKTAILDNFCWGNTDKPDTLGGLVRASMACYDIAKAYAVPFISGKDSLNNEYTVDGNSIAIPPTLLISGICVIEDELKTITMDFKSSGSLIYVVGNTFNEMGGSSYYDLFGFMGNNVPKVDAAKAKALMDKLSWAINKGLVKSSHDCSEGGVAVAISEMAFAGGIGAKIFLDQVPSGEDIVRDDTLLFSESNSRFIVEVDKKNKNKFERALNGSVFGLIGQTTEDDNLIAVGLGGDIVINAKIENLKLAWQKPLKW